MRVLVTGASGFSGAHVARGLAALGHEVTAVVGRSSPRVETEARVRVVATDLAAPHGLPARVDAVVHAAARSAWPGVSVDDLVRDNVIATRALIGYAKAGGARAFVLFSSLSVHGTISVPVVDEHTPIVDPDAYGTSKLLCEQMLAAEHESLRGFALRLPGVLGPGSVRNWMTTSLAAAREGREVRVFDPAAPFNNAVHVADLIAFIAGLIAHGSAAFEALPLGAAGTATAGEIAHAIAAGGEKGAPVVRASVRRPSYTISYERAASFGYAPMEIGAMIRRFIAENPS